VIAGRVHVGQQARYGTELGDRGLIQFNQPQHPSEVLRAQMSGLERASYCVGRAAPITGEKRLRPSRRADPRAVGARAQIREAGE